MKNEYSRKCIISIYESNNACVSACVHACVCVRYARPNLNQFQWALKYEFLTSREGSWRSFHVKNQTPPPQIRLNLAKFNRNPFVSSFLDFAMVLLHLTALTLAGQMLQIPRLERPTTPILHRPRINAVYFRPRYHISEPLNQHIARINQNSSCLVSMRSFQCEAGCYGWW